MGDIDIQKQIKMHKDAMSEAEDNLLNSGFSEGQWDLIRQFIMNAIARTQWELFQLQNSQMPEALSKIALKYPNPGILADIYRAHGERGKDKS